MLLTNALNKLVFLAFANLVLLPVYSQSQLNITNAILTNKEANIVYIGIQNPITIEAAQPADFQVTAQKSKIKIGANGDYVAMPTEPGTDSFHIVQNGKIILTKVFSAEYLPALGARLAGIVSNTASVAEVLASNKLVSAAGETLLKLNYQVLSYTIVVKSNTPETNALKIENCSDLLTEKAFAVISQLKPGDTITFENIIAGNGNRQPATLPPLIITIK